MKLPSVLAERIADGLHFRHEQKTIVAVVQDVESKEVLMVGHMNREALIRTLTTGYLHLWSTSRRRLWLKGETSGNYQLVVDLRVDCDGDAVLIFVRPQGPICHTGNRSCFYRDLGILQV
ncbi:MAG: phosphoribosyl-AMP cyclohydrolase [Ignisphaera sp.]|nr:phosphoribosyl-AMP cyclohydrolase [Ignisphaera sp.]MCX8167442.1 phosphoribosyl-AMP cyclohydrolase [Ignisphaera sp.]MDW8084694.1 phosphoribosyl-AMP cyclohydrolase [Ignisphaera sp.]